jgi:3-oxoacyl-[acyl-carrier protein] reductase
MNLALKGKVAMVAGSSRGLGYAVAKALAQEGVLISMSSRNAEAVANAARRIEADTGSQVLAMAADVQSPDALTHWHRATIDRFGGLDLLFTNCGGPPAGSTLAFDDAAWQNTFETVLLSAVRMIRLAVPSFVARGGGSIVLPTSSAVKEPIANIALSNAMRSSVAALAKTLALELAGQRIRVNHLVPGRIATDRVEEIDRINAKKAGIEIEEQRKRVFATIPMARYGEPEEFANAAVFLLSDAAAYITGASLQVDGGMIRSVL